MTSFRKRHAITTGLTELAEKKTPKCNVTRQFNVTLRWHV